MIRRRFEYHVSSTFAQTILLVLIGLLSLYFPVDHFTDRVMVVLTTLLVVVTIVSSVNQVRVHALKYACVSK